MFTKIKHFLKKAWRKLLIVLGIVSVVIVIGVVDLPIPAHERLKTDKANIIASRLYDGVVQYSYKDLNSEILWETNEYKRTPTSRHYKMGQREIDDVLHDVFLTSIIAGLPQYHEEPNGRWYQLEYGTTTEKSFERQTSYIPKSFLWQTAHAALTSVFAGAADGYVGELTNQAFNDMVDDVGDTNGGTAAESGIGMARIGALTGCSGSGTWDIMSRGVFPYDTTSITSTDTVTSSTIVLSVNGDTTQDNYSQAIEIVEKSNVGATLQNTDYASSTFGIVSFASKTVATLSANDRFSLVLNAAGNTFIEGKIAASTSTTLSTRMTADMIRTEPTCISDTSAQVGAQFSETTGTSNDPQLHIEHAAGAVAIAPVAAPLGVQQYD